MNPAIMTLNGRRYIVPHWVEVDETVTIENILDHVPYVVYKDTPNFETFPVEGKPYTIRVLSGKISCDCKGFQFRGQCKHVTAFKEGK